MAAPDAGRTYPDLPTLLQEIANATDLETALLIARARGGTRAYFAFEPAPRSWLARLVGLKKARAIGRALAPAIGVDLDIPMGPVRETARRERIETAIRHGQQTGRSRTAVALELNVCLRTIDRHTRRMRGASLLVASKKPERES